MRVSLLPRKDDQRRELEEAMARFEAAGGQVSEAQIIAGREARLLLGYRCYETAAEVSRARTEERLARPAYMRNIAAFREKSSA